jgi:hypothetical protein
MIEDKELGLKVAENADEAFWESIKSKAIKDIEMDNRAIEINNALRKFAEHKISRIKVELNFDKK